MGICDSSGNELIETKKSKITTLNKNQYKNKNNLEKNSSNNTTLD